MLMKINPEIEQILSQNLKNNEVEEGKLYLLSIYFSLYINNNIISDSVQRVVNLLGICERVYKGGSTSIKWNIPLFIGQDLPQDEWSWVITEYRAKFKELRANAGGNASTCISKMKKFFSNNPSVRKEDVLRAAEEYLSEFSDPSRLIYLQRADYFIYKSNPDKTIESRLEQYLEIIKDKEVESNLKNGRHLNGLIR